MKAILGSHRKTIVVKSPFQRTRVAVPGTGYSSLGEGQGAQWADACFALHMGGQGLTAALLGSQNWENTRFSLPHCQEVSFSKISRGPKASR